MPQLNQQLIRNGLVDEVRRAAEVNARNLFFLRRIRVGRSSITRIFRSLSILTAACSAALSVRPASALWVPSLRRFTGWGP